MRGFLKKDFLLLKSVSLPMIAILIMLLVAGIVEYIDIVYTFILWSLIGITSIFSQDTFHRTADFIASVPNGKVKAVKSRYLMAIILLIGFSFLVLCVAGIYSLLHSEFAYQYVPITMSLTISFTMLGYSLFIPLAYRFGIVKTSLFSGSWAVGGMFILMFLAESRIGEVLATYPVTKIYMCCGLLLFAMVCILYASYIISVRVYLNREK